MHKRSCFIQSLLLLFMLLCLLPGCEKPVKLQDGLYAELSTSRGTIIIQLEYEKVPLTVSSFIGLAEGILKTPPGSNKYFFNGAVFKRVIKDFMVQVGTLGTVVDDNPGYIFPDEFDPALKHDRPGTVSMVNDGPNTNGSRFLITREETPWLDKTNPVFGYVVQGQKVVDSVKEGDKINKVEILRIGSKARAFQVTEESFIALLRAADDKVIEAKRKAAAEKEQQEAAMRALKERPVDTAHLPPGLYALMKTSKGSILLALEYKKAPLTVANFVGLAEGTLKATTRNTAHFYDGLTFHRVEKNVLIQGGCPVGDGTGGPGYTFPDEIDPTLKHDAPGVLAMANSGKDTNGSQFYITLKAAPWLDNDYPVFGHTVEGMDVIKAIAVGDKIESVQILRRGSDAGKFIVNQQVFDKYKTDVLRKRSEANKQQTSAIQQQIKSKYPQAKKTATGLMYVVNKSGTGTDTPEFGDDVTVNYTGMFLDGKVFDSSRGNPATFQIGQVIAGWNEALVMMTKGAQWTLIIPPELGYGAGGAGPIPPNSYLVFEVELLDFKKN